MEDRIVKSIELKAPIARVWRALTDHEEFGEWFQVAIDGPFVAGEISTGQMTYPGFEHFPWYATILEMEQEKRFVLTWCPYIDNPDADFSKEPTTRVEFTLEPTAEGTRLTIVESGFADLPADHRREECLVRNTKGWDEVVETVKAYVGS